MSTFPESGRIADEPDWMELALEELGQYRGVYEENRERPGALVEIARQQIELGMAIVRADAVPRFRTWFSETAEFVTPPERSGPLGPASVAVEWEFNGVHDKDGAFNGLAASGRAVTIRGLTILSADNGRLQVRRYTDWVGLYAQLGLTLNWRIPLPADPAQLGGAAPGAAPAPRR
jgi:hypothetical protein